MHVHTFESLQLEGSYVGDLVFCNKGCSMFWGTYCFGMIVMSRGRGGGKRRLQRVWCLSLIFKNPEGRPGRGNGTRKGCKAKYSFLGMGCPLYDQSIRSSRDQDPGESPSKPHWSRRSSPEGLRTGTGRAWRTDQVLREISPASKEWVNLNWPRIKGTSSDASPSLCSDYMAGVILSTVILYSLVQPLQQS